MHRTLADMVLDLVQNSIEADSSLIILDYQKKDKMLTVCISDNGKGMDEETLQKVMDPFYTDGKKHNGRKVGLGLPFLKQTCETAGGKFDIRSRTGEGTSILLELNLNNLDCPPEGNRPELFMDCMIFEGGYDLAVNCEADNNNYSVVRSELKEVLGNLNDGESLVLLKKYLGGLED